MAHLWIQEPTSRAWRAAVLRDGARVADVGRPFAGAAAESDGAAHSAQLHAVAGLWVLTAPAQARVNGSPLVGGLRVLRDRDELRVGPVRAFFSEEEPPRVVAFPGAEQPVHCGRCKRLLPIGDPAVRCRCGIWHHETAEDPCWSHIDHCSLCDQPTVLDGRYRWSPDTL